MPISSIPINISDPLAFNEKRRVPTVKDTTPAETKSEGLTKTDEQSKPVESKNRKQSLRGRLGVGSHIYFSNTSAENSRRMRYTFSLKAGNIANSRFSAESYIIF